MKKYDLIVVGAGNLGTFHAYHALQMGKSVLMIEKDSEPMEATVRNFGQVALWTSP
jgi:glycine/D-amino acid oxidase-like deaminating enzyme